MRGDVTGFTELGSWSKLTRGNVTGFIKLGSWEGWSQLTRGDVTGFKLGIAGRAVLN